MSKSSFEINIYQIAGDDTLKMHRRDGTGWDWGWAERRREWMDATQDHFAYRCLPLTIANQVGLWIRNPVGFTALWRGDARANTVEFRFDAAGEFWKNWVTNHFGYGIITWNTPFLFRTNPPGSRLLICGPVNYFKPNLHPLTAMIESDWIPMSFTMNWKMTWPNETVRFDLGEPIFQAIPLASNICADLEGATVNYCRLEDNPEIHASYKEWQKARDEFHKQQSRGEVREGWQKHYFHGQDVAGREADTEHHTKVTPPRIRFARNTHRNAPEGLVA
jgi:hypothetical protein